MDVIELLNKQKLSYTVSGQDYTIQCLSPDHEDNNPSLRIDKISGVMNCFSCGFKGNIFTHFQVTPTGKQIKIEKLKSMINKMRSQGVGLKMPDKFISYMGTFRGIKGETLKEFGAFTHFEKTYTGRLVFPLKDSTGKIRAFIGRGMDNTVQPKYKIHPPGAKLPMFPALPGIKEGQVLLVEGIFDALNLIDKGISNVVCVFGTNNFNKTKLSLLKIQGVESIGVLFDGDIAGRTAAQKIVEMCEEENMPASIIPITEGEDPGGLTQDRVNSLKEYLYG